MKTAFQNEGEGEGGRGRVGWGWILPGLLLLLLLAAVGAGCGGVSRTGDGVERLGRYEFERPQMGVPFRLVIHAPDERTAAEGAEAAFARVSELNGILSDYDPDSEVSRVCLGTPVGQPARVSQELGHMLERSQALARATDGAFDVTVGPMVNLWRRSRRRLELPATHLVEQARARVGWQRMRVDARARTVTFLVAGMRLDFGGIAKGYAADEALRVLRERGLTRVLVAAAGDVVVGEPPPGQRAWRVEVGGTEGTNGPPARIALLRNAAVSTSGDMFQRLEIGGRRYSHIVDPRTGIGLTDGGLVTVIARDGTTADSLSTAVSVLGPERGLRLVERTRGAAALIVRGGEGGVEIRESRRFQRWVGR